MANTSGIFTGASRYASDFSGWIDRAVNIASLHLMQLQSQRTALGNRQSALSSVDSKVASFQSAVTTLAGALGPSSFAVSNSDPAAVKATAGSGVREGVYQIEVTDLGAYAGALSKAPGGGISQVSDPASQNISSDTTFKLYLDGSETPILITPSQANLNSLVEAINAQAPEVQATIVNAGGHSGADYRLSIQHRKLGPHAISLTDSAGAALLDMVAEGSYARYRVQGGAEVESESRSVTLAPGLDVELLKTSSNGAATITVTRSATGIGNALSALATAYNGVMEELNAHRGKAGGALTGDLALTAVQDAMRRIVSYASGSGDIQSLTALGIELSDSGVMSFNSSTFEAAVKDNFDALASFLGDQTTGGFLKQATDLLNSLEDSSAGIIRSSVSSLEDQIAAQDQLISAEQDRIEQYRASLQERMYAADALIAALEQQVLYFSQMFEAMRIAQKNL